MKIPDIGDVMNKFEVLGIVGEGKNAYLFQMCQTVFSPLMVESNLQAQPFLYTLVRVFLFVVFLLVCVCFYSYQSFNGLNSIT